MQKIRIDFDNPGLPQHINAVENDSQSRFFQATLYENGKAYTAPEGATYSIMYRGFGPQNQGWYDTINDGAGKRAACAVSGNVVTCEIARQALQVPGHVIIVLCVTTGKGYMLKSWPIECDCKNDRYDSTVEIQSFFYVTQISNESWTQAIQAVEELKNTIDPTLSVSGKAADAAKVGEAVGQVKEDLGNLSSDDGIKSNMIDGSFTGYREKDIETNYIEKNAWYVTGNNTVGKTGSGQIVVGKETSSGVVDLRTCSGKLTIGFSNTLGMYGSNFIIVGDSTSVGANVVTYYNKNNALNNYDDLFDTSKINSDAYVIFDIDKLKKKYPSAVGLFVNEPTSIWKLTNLISASKKKLKWLQVSGFIPAIVVDKNGNGDYTSIQEAISNAEDNDTIYIKDGIYTETVVVDKYVHLVGQSKQGTILQQNIGNYANCPLLTTQGSVCNMTIKSIAPPDVSGLADYAYAIHLDKNFSEIHGKCEIYNCIIESEVNDAIGAGTNYNQVFDLHDNFIHVSSNPVKSGSCGFKCHIGNAQTGGKVTLKNNTIIAENSNGTTFYDILFHSGGNTPTKNVEVELIGNVCKTYRGVEYYELNPYCFGNSVDAMNTIK